MERKCRNEKEGWGKRREQELSNVFSRDKLTNRKRYKYKKEENIT